MSVHRMTVDTWMTRAHRNAGWLMVLGVLQMILGVLVLGSPLAGGLAVTVLIGASLLVAGILRLAATFAADSFGSGALAFVWGLVVASTGFYLVTHPAMGLASLTLALSMMFFLSGLAECVVAFQTRPERGWGWLLAGGIVSVILAVLVWRQFPLSGAWLVGTLVGIHLIATGLSTTMVGSAARELADRT